MDETRVDMSDVERGLAALERAGGNVGQVLNDLKKPLRTDLREHQRARRGPDGPWDAPAAETVRKRGRTKTGRRKRKRTLGKLSGQVSMRVEQGEDLVARNKVPWADVHQEGGTVGHGAEIPARPFMYMSDDFLEQAEEKIDEHLADAWGRG